MRRDGDVLATLPLPGGAVQVLRSDALDPDAAAERLAARREALRAEIARAEGKLANVSSCRSSRRSAATACRGVTVGDADPLDAGAAEPTSPRSVLVPGPCCRPTPSRLVRPRARR